MILSGKTIRDYEPQILTPFSERTLHRGLTNGVGPAGYDVRIEFDERGSIEKKAIVSGTFLLASTIEEFCMPPDVMGIVHDKSTWARRGLAVQNTVIEPGWKGYLTLELTNHGQEPIILERGMPIAQVVFHWVDFPVEGYDGKYQNQQRGPQAAR